MTDPASAHEALQAALNVARGLAAAGIPVFVAYPDRAKPGEYKPPKGWQATTPNAAYVDAWQPGRALCAVMGHGLDLVDIDPRNGGDAGALSGILPEVIGMARSPSGGYHLFVRSMGVRSRDGVLPGIDVKAGDPSGQGHGFAFIAPTIRTSKVTGELAAYGWVKEPALSRLNGVTGADSKLAQIVRQAHGSRSTGSFSQPGQAERKHTGPIPYGEHHPRLVSYAGWLRSKAIPLHPEAETLMLQRLRDVVQPADAGRAVYTDEEVLSELRDVYSRYAAGDPAAEQAAERGADPEHFPRTQLDWGLRFAARKGSSLHYVHGISWHVWDGTRWKPDADGEALRAYSDMVKAAYAELGSLDEDERKKAFKDLLAAQRRNSAAGALDFAAVRPRMAIAAELLDAGRMLLNCANGTLDLETMRLRPHDPADNITKVCRGAWQPGLGETRWAKFVAEILPDAEIRDFVQRLMGSTLPGRVREHVLPILTGTGGNGKSTFIETIMHTLGGYALQADPTLLMASSHDSHPTGQAALQSRRLAVCMETAQGRKLDAPTAKHLTGGDTITARYMRQNFFSFEPSHTIIMVTNHKPIVDGSDEALWRRLAVIPFEQTFSGDQAQPDLKEQLEAGPDAILSWMIEGWNAYREKGLLIPNAVRAATDAYKADSDAVGRFIEERLYPTQFGTVPSSQLFTEWQKWCVANGEDSATQKAFSAELARRGFVRVKKNRGNVWKGFTLLASENDDGVEGGGGFSGSPHTRARISVHTEDHPPPSTEPLEGWE